MPALSLRLSDDLEHRLQEEALREGTPRSEVVRIAIADYLSRRDRERFMAELVAEARSAYANEDIRREAREIAKEALIAGNEALAIADERKPGEPWPEASGEKWWK
jgi:metal-responsive CopG/Arc/MetJ family transcriptional regulator